VDVNDDADDDDADDGFAPNAVLICIVGEIGKRWSAENFLINDELENGLFNVGVRMEVVVIVFKPDLRTLFGVSNVLRNVFELLVDESNVKWVPLIVFPPWRRSTELNKPGDEFGKSLRIIDEVEPVGDFGWFCCCSLWACTRRLKSSSFWNESDENGSTGWIKIPICCCWNWANEGETAGLNGSREDDFGNCDNCCCLDGNNNDGLYNCEILLWILLLLLW